MQCLGSPPSATGGSTWAVSVRELAAAGQPPIILQDCLRWLALRGLTTPRLFSLAALPRSEERRLLALRHLYETGRRPLRSKSCRDKDPHLVASLLLLWLRALPEPLFPAHLVPELVESQQSDYYEERVAAVRGLLKRAEPFVVETLFPLFELLHHYWINQADRDACLQELGRLMAAPVFGAPASHGLPPEDGGLLSDTVEMLISEYRPLFTQPFNLRRYEADSARQAAQQAVQQAAQQAADAQRAESHSHQLGTPLLTPIRCERLSVMAPEGSSPFSDCCATPLPASPVSLYLASREASAADGAPLGISPPFSPMAASPRQRPATGTAFSAWQADGAGGDPFAGEAANSRPGSAGGQPHEHEDEHLEQRFSDLLESTVSGMLFEQPLPPAPASAAPGGGAGQTALACGPVGGAGAVLAAEQPGSPVAVVRGMAGDGGDSTDGSDCDAPMAGDPFAWPHSKPLPGLATC